MGEFFKQLIAQLSSIWEKLSMQQRIIISALVGLMFFGLFALVIWSGSNGPDGDSGGGKGAKNSKSMRLLFNKVPVEDMANITEELDKGAMKYELRSDGTAIYVAEKDLYTARMALAREGLPARKGVGFELFDKVDLGATDFEQKIKIQRAIQGELTRTVESLKEIESARIHVVMPKESIFLEEKSPAKASITLKVRAGEKLSKDQIRGIAYLVSNSIDGLDPDNVTIVDGTGRLLSNPYKDDETALASSRNVELQANVESMLQRKVETLLGGILGEGKASVTISADLDFDQVEQNVEKFDPESKVVRSEERDETAVKNAPDGDRTNERSLANYEINKTVEKIIKEVGALRRLTISVAVNGKYVTKEDGKRDYQERTPEELANIDAIVKNAVGYDLARGDRISVVSMQFDETNAFEIDEEAKKMEKGIVFEKVAQYGVLIFIFIILIVMVSKLAKSMVEAMNPPLPEVEIPNIIEEEEVVIQLPKNIARSNELLERVEIMTENDPNNVARIIKDWLNEAPVKKEK